MYPRQKSINHGFLFHFRWQCKTGKITMRELVLLSTMMLILISWCEMHGSCSYTCKSLPRGATFHSECEYTGTCILEVNLHWMYTPILHIKMRTEWQIFFQNVEDHLAWRFEVSRYCSLSWQPGPHRAAVFTPMHHFHFWHSSRREGWSVSTKISKHDTE